MVKGNKSVLCHTEQQSPRLQKDEEAVSAVVGLINGWVNPFAGKQDLINIFTAKAAPKEIASDLMKAYEIGEKCYASFKKERLEEDPPAKKFPDLMKTNKRKTFSNMCKKREVKSNGRAVILDAVYTWRISFDQKFVTKPVLLTSLCKNG